ncbi:MAG TPA: hypothetical protein HPP80_03220 [Rhodospirillaceae bacterium]|nr:hypothetical protein [Rhodospirillaceae bacterium]
MLLIRIKQILKYLLLAVWAVFVLIEDLLWEPLGRLMAELGRWAPVARLELAIGRLPPYAAMVLFIVPWAIILPVKLAALWLLASGRPGLGAVLFLFGEVLGMALLARLYALCRPALHQLPWFVWIETQLRRWSAWAHDLMNQWLWWRWVKRTLHRLTARLKQGAHLLRQRVVAWLTRLGVS